MYYTIETTFIIIVDFKKLKNLKFLLFWIGNDNYQLLMTWKDGFILIKNSERVVFNNIAFWYSRIIFNI